ncbi:hypothetical protein [Microcoleus sp. PH2017_05_CCC_O_A]|uniref:hypothetical protein n=1 Tax=Microcoleus sp. PH2017_05_CCC_O_A TaxID=2798816 RepID=UPI001D616A14|nr:hypothetical protein [Microcoleus sp. PH2017_05_CCC_O_A]MCC3412522.1 hypothetical protein [Microcoleus sp. PH2017_02_FOX_O_A]MCC3467598.1 hypothetical protein [Microcoleus sp. PH2017_06_SFM_O_A]MCC3504767.1 hypothetical protein [Microcoleus sp. PH2017_19_SFW_U_A]MCC3569862.1 hypothetical protein [Microcoleus sp. PH2017_31_RDM_U_A]MCC3582221.1 hypothetical protein [Microcoleus sp. PH2017_32_RDM_D_A]MCC3629901.1 hypothetical protein [Microcoleus sp. PH2017_39_LGB_O_B]
MLEVGMRRSPVVPIHMWHYILKPNFEEGHSSGAKSIARNIEPPFFGDAHQLYRAIASQPLASQPQRDRHHIKLYKIT